MILCPIHESNDCHTPAGSPAGGQFCGPGTSSAGATGYTEGLDPKVAQGLRKLQQSLMQASFGGGKRIETMQVLDAETGRTIGQMLVGDDDAIDIPRDVTTHWADHPSPIITAHTHPASSTFSIEDLEFHNELNQRRMRAFNGPVQRMIVFGEDGSWYEMTYPPYGAVLPKRDADQMRRAFDVERRNAGDRASLRTTKWAEAQSWWATRPPKTWDLMSMEEHVRSAAEKGGALETLIATHHRHFQEESKDLWKGIAERHGLGYRYYQAPRHTH